MVDVLRPLRLNAVELLRQPGTIRRVEASIEPEPLGVVDDRLRGEIAVDLELEVHNDGITVTGRIAAPWADVCRRCLAPVTGTALGVVDELYQVELLDPDAFLIEDGQLDLAPLVRETVLLELDVERVCREECAGLCPVCGVDRNETDCDCDTSVTDDRWAALEGFVPDER